MVALSLVAVILGLGFIIVRAFKGHPPFLSCLIAVVFISILSGLSIPNAIATSFATGTANMLRSMLLFFCACTLFGKVMEDAGYAHSITYFISDHVNAFWAPTIIFLTTVVLAMGGMLIATCIIVYPIGYRLLKKAGYSRRILAGASVLPLGGIACDFGGNGDHRQKPGDHCRRKGLRPRRVHPQYGLGNQPEESGASASVGGCPVGPTEIREKEEQMLLLLSS